jgi:hypothetical protein
MRRAQRDHRVAEDAEVGTAALAVDGIERGRRAGVELRQEGGHEMSAGGRAHHPDPARVDP